MTVISCLFLYFCSHCIKEFSVQCSVGSACSNLLFLARLSMLTWIEHTSADSSLTTTFICINRFFFIFQLIAFSPAKHTYYLKKMLREKLLFHSLNDLLEGKDQEKCLVSHCTKKIASAFLWLLTNVSGIHLLQCGTPSQLVTRPPIKILRWERCCVRLGLSLSPRSSAAATGWRTSHSSCKIYHDILDSIARSWDWDLWFNAKLLWKSWGLWGTFLDIGSLFPRL